MRLSRTVLLVALVAGPAVAVAQSADSTLPPGFARRSTRKGAGKYYTAADIAKMHATATPQLLARLSGADLRDVGNGESALVSRRGLRQAFSAPVENELCRIGIMVNERLMPDGFDLKSIAIPAILAVEAYSGPATIPPDLNATAGEAGRCGLIVIWVQGGG